MSRRGTPLALVAVVVAACSGPILANPAATHRPVPTGTPAPTRLVDPQPIIFPRDDGPHDRLTEWWYYTGHLEAADGGRFGFEFVVFRAERGEFPVTWASHLALTNESEAAFWYAERSLIGPQGGGAPSFYRFNHEITAPERPETWTMRRSGVGIGSVDEVSVGLSPSEAARAGRDFGFDLDLRMTKREALHDGDGWIDFGPAGSSYYYSRTRMDAAGTLSLDGEELDVTGTAWFDHQWGDFVSVGGGGWDWFAVNLADGTDLTISLVRAADGSYPLVYGTCVDPDGTSRHLEADDFAVEADPERTWTSPWTGATYPAGWTITVPAEDLVIDLEPTVADQELDTRATTGVVYWEGSQIVQATRSRQPVAGEAYVELTGYATEP